MSQPTVKRDKSYPGLQFLKVFKHHAVLGVLIAVLTFGWMFSLTLTAVAPKRYELSAGDIAPESIPAARDVEDRLATQELILQAQERVPDLYALDQIITANTIAELNGIFERMETVRNMAADRLREWEDEQAAEAAREAAAARELSEEEQEGEPDAQETDPATEVPQQMEAVPEELYDQEFLDSVRSALIIEMSHEDLLTVITADQREINLLRSRLVTIMTDMLESGIKWEQVPEARTRLREEIQSIPVSGEVRLLGIAAGIPQLRANMLHDPDKTLEEKERAADRVERVMYKKGQFIVQAGQPVTIPQIEVLRELGLLKDEHVDIHFYTGIGIVVLLILGFVIFYLLYFEKELLKKPLMLLMISLVSSLVLGLSYVTSILHPYAIPAAMGGMLLTILLRPRIGIVINTALALYLGVMQEFQMGVVIVVMIGGMIGICMLNKMQQRNTLIWAGVAVSGLSILTILGFEMVTTGEWTASVHTSLWGAVGGMLAAVLTVGTLPIWENLFSVITPLRLLEMANPNHPVLKRLLMETPGTYHHSIIVANLAENAADAVGGNALLARVGAYYHDIGKLQRPYYFKENQLYTDNPHDKLDPVLSTRIITSHTLDGIVLANRYKVPRILHEFILQHHGTTPVVYFYHKAKNSEDANKNIHLDKFRYPGPKPTSKETAIVMMADTVEAAVRALPEPDPAKVETLIRRLMKEKMDDGQLDACPLTIKDLDTIAIAFMNAIGGIFHERVKYPEVNLKEEKGQGDNDTTD